jgi:uncharacterized protein
MLSAKPWKADAIVRLFLGVFVCIYAGALLSAAMRFSGGHRAAWKFYPLAMAAFGCLGTTLVLLRRPWRLEEVMRRLAVLLGCFYMGLVLGVCAQSVAGSLGPSVGQMIVGALSFQGAALILTELFVREHQTGWVEAFGLGNRWLHAVLLGGLVACLFLPVGNGLQWLSAEVMMRLPWLHLKPEEQLAVQTLQMASGWMERLALGVVTIALAPLAEEILFRGILYPWIKQAGYPRLALWGTVLLFAAIHLNLMTFVPLAVLALALTFLYERTDNLLAPVVAHALFNALNFARLYWMERAVS